MTAPKLKVSLAILCGMLVRCDLRARHWNEMCSDAAAFVIGHALVVDGGQTIT